VNLVDVGSPVNIQASASPTAGQTISGWKVYVGGSTSYTGGSVNSINTNIGMKTGTHSVTVRAWDTSGAYADQKLTLTVSAKPAVAVTAPLGGSSVISPVSIQASAAASSGHSITGWVVYVDSKSKYKAGAVTSIRPSISTSAGSHTILVRAWDSSGDYGDQTFSIDVNKVAVNISTPANNASVVSPANLVADGASATNITGWEIYVDGISWFAQDFGSAVDANLAIGSGTHTVLVRAWDSTGAFGDQTINVSVP
jgi:hypothetical protein